MRLFIAIQLSDEMREALCRVQEAFMRHGVTGNYTRRENLHLTLAFIGEYSDPEAVLDVIDGTPLRPFDIALDGGVGAFEDLWWAGLKRSEALTAYVRTLRHNLAEAGIPFDSKRFRPHITLLRKAVYGARRLPLMSVPRAGMTVERASLIRSDRGKAGMIYTEIL